VRACVQALKRSQLRAHIQPPFERDFVLQQFKIKRRALILVFIQMPASNVLFQDGTLHRTAVKFPTGGKQVSLCMGMRRLIRKYVVRSSISRLKFSRSGQFFPTFTIALELARRSPPAKERILFVKGCKSLRHVIN